MTQHSSIAIQWYRTSVGTAFSILLGSLFLVFMSQIALFLPYTPIPQTMQTLGVFLLGGLLGPKKGALAVVAYLIEGSCGLPVFAGALAKPLWFCGPTAGFLLSFVAAAFFIGWCIQTRRSYSLSFLVGVLLIAQALIFFCGWGWLAFFIGPKAAFLSAVVPFVVGSLFKCISAAFLLKGYILIGKGRWSQ